MSAKLANFFCKFANTLQTMTRNKGQRIEREVCNSLKSSVITSVLAAVSGGADSIALLSALSCIQNLSLTAAHCNFHLRGNESDRDQRHVEETCRHLGVQLLTKDFNVSNYIRNHPGTSLEMACRDLRYDWFRSIMGNAGIQRVATGHNADDNIETMLLNMLRGSGTSGLRGMAADNGFVLRPLLEISRKEILEYLETKGLGFVTDSSNLASDYRRNFLRNEILPLLRSRWPGADAALSRTLHNIREESKVVNRFIETTTNQDADSISTTTIVGFPSPELLVRRFIESFRPFTTTASEIVGAIHAGKSDVRRWNLPGGMIELRGEKLLKKRVH